MQYHQDTSFPLLVCGQTCCTFHHILVMTFTLPILIETARLQNRSILVDSSTNFRLSSFLVGLDPRHVPMSGFPKGRLQHVWRVKNHAQS